LAESPALKTSTIPKILKVARPDVYPTPSVLHARALLKKYSKSHLCIRQFQQIIDSDFHLEEETRNIEKVRAPKKY